MSDVRPECFGADVCPAPGYDVLLCSHLCECALASTMQTVAWSDIVLWQALPWYKRLWYYLTDGPREAR